MHFPIIAYAESNIALHTNTHDLSNACTHALTNIRFLSWSSVSILLAPAICPPKAATQPPVVAPTLNPTSASTPSPASETTQATTIRPTQHHAGRLLRQVHYENIPQQSFENKIDQSNKVTIQRPLQSVPANPPGSRGGSDFLYDVRLVLGSMLED
jgi:hypothetical protein